MEDNDQFFSWDCWNQAGVTDIDIDIVKTSKGGLSCCGVVSVRLYVSSEWTAKELQLGGTRIVSSGSTKVTYQGRPPHGEQVVTRNGGVVGGRRDGEADGQRLPVGSAQ